MKKSIRVFENGVWFYNEYFVKTIKEDFNEIFEKSILINNKKYKVNVFKRVLRVFLKLISPLL